MNPGWVSWVKDPFFLLAASSAFSLDQVSKAIVLNRLFYGQSVPYDGFFRITLTSNTGGAFGLFPDQTMVLVLASFVAIGILFFLYRSHALSSPLLRLSLGLQLGGALGNLVDRIRLGAVTDFIDVGPWPIFNVADASIVVGILLLLFLLLSPNKQERTGQPRPYGAKGGVSLTVDRSAGMVQGDLGTALLLGCPLCNTEVRYTGGVWLCPGCGVTYGNRGAQ
ncbi:MAG: signal peptidase II [Dehalococcoidia bacterium]|nr:signal peptidase II [Dehalococcoidia bacterium]